ncbi:nuclear transport factor 2 family protein [Mycobacterium sp.]|uniref:nuclear transport factor 2 family protein n=1 Tax=Mycobacterium sp. TaxID=1785 RepID=UPI0025F62A81|nr:nuclear transport factor 2 family protein [Mycobacterium sp.]MBW0011704.1 nuclear transport factor 2 family protein [Mycobacterium sp.]
MSLSVEDRAALSDVVHRYAAGVDDRQFDCVTELFIPSGELLVPDPPAALEPVHFHRGHRAIAAAVAAAATVTRTEHAIIGEVYDAGARPGVARGRIACIAHHWTPHGDEARDVVWHLRYDDDYVLTDAVWRIGRRALTIQALETRPIRRLLPRDPA